jgi:hypothetical protein
MMKKCEESSDEVKAEEQESISNLAAAETTKWTADLPQPTYAVQEVACHYNGRHPIWRWLLSSYPSTGCGSPECLERAP